MGEVFVVKSAGITRVYACERDAVAADQVRYADEAFRASAESFLPLGRRGKIWEPRAVYCGLGDLLGTAALQEGRIRWESGRRVTFQYFRNPQRAPNLGARFGQDIEPAGRYMQHASSGVNVEGLQRDGWEVGRQPFKMPLVLLFTGYGPDGWKARLHRAFGGLVGADLSRALQRIGFDGIVTLVEENGAGTRPYRSGEIVDFSLVR